MTPNEGREIASLPPVEGGDKLLQPANMTPDPAGSAPDAGTDAGTDQARAIASSEFDRRCLEALADVAGRMIKRLNVQIERTKADQWREFCDTVEEKHGEVIRSAFASLVPLCGGDESRLAAVSARFVELARKNGDAGVPISSEPRTVASEVLHIIRQRT